MCVWGGVGWGGGGGGRDSNPPVLAGNLPFLATISRQGFPYIFYNLPVFDLINRHTFAIIAVNLGEISRFFVSRGWNLWRRAGAGKFAGGRLQFVGSHLGRVSFFWPAGGVLDVRLGRRVPPGL